MICSRRVGRNEDDVIISKMSQENFKKEKDKTVQDPFEIVRKRKEGNSTIFIIFCNIKNNHSVCKEYSTIFKFYKI